MIRSFHLLLLPLMLLGLAVGCDDSASEQVSTRPAVEKPKEPPKPPVKPAVDPHNTLAGHPNAHPANAPKNWEPVSTTSGNPSSSGRFDLLAQGEDDMSRALSRVSAEISESLKLKKTLVVWLLDRSADSSGVRRSIAGQISQVAQSSVARAKSHGGTAAPLYMAAGPGLWKDGRYRHAGTDRRSVESRKRGFGTGG